MKTRKTAAAAPPCRYRGNVCKILSGDNHLQFCDKHYKFHTDFLRNNPSILKKSQLDLLGSDTPDPIKKRVKKKKSNLPPDEERCCRNDGMIWRCKKYRMKSGGDTKNFCEEHYRSNLEHCKILCMKKKMKREAGLSNRVAETRDSNRFNRPARRQLTDQPSTSNPTTSSDTIGAKRKRVERMSGDLESLTGITPVVETRASKRRKMVMGGDETSNQPAINDNFESDGIVEGGPPKIGTKRINVEKTKGSGEPVIELESVELYKSKCFELSMQLEKNKVELGKMKVELEKTKVELEKKKVECTEFQGKLAEVEETRKSTAKDEKATEFWRKRCSDLESGVQRMENETSTMTCVESRVSNLGSLVAWNGKESSILRCQELSYSEKIESEARGLQIEITQTDEKQRDENNMSEPTTSSDRITEGASPNVWTKMKNVESTKGSGEPVNDQLESVEPYKSNCFELSMEPEKNKVELEKNEVELEKNVESTKGSGEPVNDQLQSVELDKSNFFELSMEPEKNKVELEKNEVELENNEVELEKNVESTQGSGEPVNDQLESMELDKSNFFELSMEPEKNKVELEKNEVELQNNEVELEKNEVELQKNEVELEKNVESTKGSGEPVNDQLESMELYKSNCFELSMEPEMNKVELEKVKVELEKNEVELEKNVESTKGSGEPVNDQLESVELDKSNFFELSMEPEKNKVKLEKNEVELQNNEVELENNEVELEKNVESTKGSGEPVNDQLESMELYKSNCFELSMEPEMNKVELEKVKAELEKNEVELEKNVESTKGSGEPVNDQLESVEPYKSNCFELSMEPEMNMVELEKVKAELEKNEVELEKNVESTKGSGEPVNDQLESVEPYKSNCFELSMEPEKNKVELEKVKAELEKNVVELQKNEVELQKNVESTKGSGEPVNDQLESMELYKSNCFELSMEPEMNKVELEKNEVELEKKKVELEKNKVDPEKMKAELEKKKVECTEFQDKLAEVEETRKSTSKDENATEFWRTKCSDAVILVQRMENENSTIGCVETRISNLVSLVPGNGKESSILRCQELSYSEKVESEARGLQNEITQTCEKQRDQDMSKPNAETIGEGSKDSRAYELKTEEKVLNIEEGKGWGCLEERPSQHGSSSQVDLDMCKKTSMNLVSDSIDGGDSLGAVDSLGDSMDMLAMKNLNMIEDKMTEADMLSSVEDCMKAVGALYHQEISKD